MTTTPTTVLVTGAAGRLGRAVSAAFCQAGLDVVATDVVATDAVDGVDAVLPSQPADVGDADGADDAVDAVDAVHAGPGRYRFVAADLRDHAAVSALFDDISVVAHLGNHPGIGRRPPQLVFDENVSMNANVFQAAAEAGARHIVFASTIQLFGSHPDERTVVHLPERPRFPLGPDTPPRPSNLYSLSKLVSETMLRYYAERCGLTCTALRLPLLHHGDGRALVGAGEERPADVFEGFTGLTYDEAADLFVAVVRTGGEGMSVHVAGTSHRHRDLRLADLIRTYYPGTPTDLDDLVDLAPVIAATGWSPREREPG